MNQDELDLVAQVGLGKYTVCRQAPAHYFVRAILAGFYLVLGMLACNITMAVFSATNPALGRVLGSLAFSLGLVSIVMLGGELFTGNNFVLAVSSLEKKTSWGGAARVWLMSYLGNAVGSIIIVSIVAWGGTVNSILADATAASLTAKLSLTAGQMVFRGIMCNFIVCAAVLAGIKIKDVPGKITVIVLLIFSFVIAGYEHCIANMGFFTLAFYLVPDVDFLQMLRSMLWVTIGNILGGAVMLGLPYWFTSRAGFKQSAK